LALSNSSAGCSGKDVGFANPLLYQVAAGDPAAFNDITTGNNDLTGKNDGVYPALVGYDMATGLGTPNAAALSELLCDAATTDPVTVTNPGNQSSVVGQAVDLAIQASDSTPGQTLSYAATNLPTGLSLDTTDGVITGAPSAAGTFPSTVTARDQNGASASADFTWTVVEAITSADTAKAVIDKPFTFTITATGDPRSIKTTGTLPKGIKLHKEGSASSELSGTPKSTDAAGTYSLIISATYGRGKTAVVATQDFTLKLASK
jgi:hypothetical protein